LSISEYHLPFRSGVLLATPGPLQVREGVDFVDQRIPLPLSLCLTPGDGRRAACGRPVVFGFPRSVVSLPFRKGNLERELAYSVLCRLLAHSSLTRPSWLRPLHCSRLSPGVTATMSRSDSSVAPGRLVALATPVPVGMIGSGRSGRGLPRLRPSLFHPIPAPTTLRVPVPGFVTLGRLAHPCRRIAFTFVPGWGLTRTLHRSLTGASLSLSTGGKAFAQVLLTGFEPASNVRCEAHPSRPASTPESAKADLAPLLP